MPISNLNQPVTIPLPIPIEFGGTNASNATAARANLQALGEVDRPTITGRFGNHYPHGDFSDANQASDIRGWVFIIGATNTPRSEGQLYRLNVGLGSQYPSNYGMEMGIPRYREELHIRKQEGGVWSDWLRLDIPCIDAAGNRLAIGNCYLTGMTAAVQGATVSVGLPYGISVNSLIGINALIEFSPSQFVETNFNNGNSGYEASVYANGNVVWLVNHPTNSANILNKPFRILLTYLL